MARRGAEKVCYGEESALLEDVMTLPKTDV